ncbi:unnamed protein product, partial [Phaeothamnion confervicola]
KRKREGTSALYKMPSHKHKHKKHKHRRHSESSDDSEEERRRESSTEESAKEEEKEGGDEETKKRRNREETLKRSRMWTTVGSDDEDDGDGEKTKAKVEAARDSGDESSEDSRGSEKRRHKEKKRKKEKRKHKDRKRDDDRDDRHGKKERKHRRHKDKEKDKSRPHSRKRSQRDVGGGGSGSSDGSSDDFSGGEGRGGGGGGGKRPGAVDQSRYGKYGILRESDFFTKQREFEAWMREIKGIGGVLQLPKQEVREHFKGYIEDFNTATMPHKKFINYAGWEMEEYARQKAKEAKGAAAAAGKQAARFDEERRQRKAEEDRSFQTLIMQSMSKGKVEEMRQQERLKTEMQLAYKQGAWAFGTKAGGAADSAVLCGFLPGLIGRFWAEGTLRRHDCCHNCMTDYCLPGGLLSRCRAMRVRKRSVRPLLFHTAGIVCHWYP